MINSGSPNVNRVDTMPTTTDPINTLTTTNVSQSVFDENLPQLLDSRGGDSDVEEDQRTSNEFMAVLNAEYHKRALLENQKRFYKRSGRNIVKALGKKGRRKEKISSKEVLYTKADESSYVLAPEITSNSESECDSQEPLPPLPKLIGVAPSGTSESLISLSDLTLNMADLIVDTPVPKKTRPSVKVLPAYVLKKMTEKSPTVTQPCSYKKADSSTEQLLLTLMEEVKGLKRRPRIANRQSEPVKSGFIKGTNLYSKESGPKVVFRDDSSGDTKGYGSVKYNGITFTKWLKLSGCSTSEDKKWKKQYMLHSVKMMKPFLNPAQKDRWSREKHIKVVNIIGEPLAGITTRSRIKDSDAASAFKHLYVIFLSKMEPKKLIEALEEEGLEAIRIFLAYAAYMGFMVYYMDVKSAFLNGKILEDVYVQQPPGFESSEFPNHVCKLDKALYGLKQAPKAWYQANPKESHLVAVKRIFRYHFIINYILKGDIELYFVPTDLQLTDIFTKPLAEPSFTRLVAELEVEEETKTTTFLLSWWDKPLFFTQDEFISAIVLLTCKDAVFVPPPPKEIVKAGLPKQSLIPPSEEVNVDDTANKSFSRASVQPVTPPKAPTNLTVKKKRIQRSSKPKSPYKVRVILPKKQVDKTQHAKVTMATANVTQSLAASELAEEQVNQPSAAEAEKSSSHDHEDQDEFNITPKDVKEGDASESLYGLCFMPVDDLAFMTGFETQDSADHVSKEESSITKYVSDSIQAIVPVIVTNTLKEKLHGLLLDALKDTLSWLIKDTIKSFALESIAEELPQVEA
nr:retrovirus-related Pol polyprotein from transposon TNT 1-94 [Tanacetum cinerariifolium]